jgi:hypothetical protein
MVVSDSRSTAPRRAWKVCPLVLQTSEEAKMSTTRSVFGRIWQASARPSAASSSVSASSMYSPLSYSPDCTRHLQVPQAPSRQSSGMLIPTR